MMRLGLILGLICALRAEAHGVYIECKLRDDRVTVEGFYEDDKPTIGAQVIVTNKAGEEIARGTTDDRGFWSFAKPTPAKYFVELNAGDGHRTKTTFVVPTAGALEHLNVLDKKGAEVIITSGPTRMERIRFPWGRVGLGLSSLAVLATVLWLGLRQKKSDYRK